MLFRNVNITSNIINKQNILEEKVDVEISTIQKIKNFFKFKNDDDELNNSINDYQNYSKEQETRINDDKYLLNLLSAFCSKYLPSDYYYHEKNISDRDVLTHLDIDNKVFNSIQQCKSLTGKYMLNNYLMNPHSNKSLIYKIQHNIRELHESPHKLKVASGILTEYSRIERQLLLLFERIPMEACKLYSVLYFQHKYLKFLNKSSFFLTIANFYNIYFIPFSSLISPIYMILSIFISIISIYRVKLRDIIMMVKFIYTHYFKNFSKNYSKNFMITLSFLSGGLFYIYSYLQTNYLIYKQSKYLYQVLNIIKSKVSNITKLVILYRRQFQEISFTRNLSVDDNLLYNIFDTGSYLQIFNDFNLNKEKILPYILSMGYLDMIYSNVILLNTKPVCYAKLHDTQIPMYNSKHLTHPCLNNGIPNSIYNITNLCITGPNASGKSVFIKSILISIIMSQSIGICYCESLELSIFKHLDALFNISDCVGDESLFEAQVSRIYKNIKIKDSKPSILLVDEMLNSTNYVMGVSSAYAILDYLIQNRNNITLCATHYKYLTQLESKYPKLIRNIYFDGMICDDKIKYTYKYKNGISNNILTFEILDKYKFPKSIISQAQKISKIFTKNKKYI